MQSHSGSALTDAYPVERPPHALETQTAMIIPCPGTPPTEKSSSRLVQCEHRTPVRPLNSSVIDQSTGPCLPRTIGATVHVHSALDPVTDNTNPASPARRRQSVNSALERVELV